MPTHSMENTSWCNCLQCGFTQSTTTNEHYGCLLHLPSPFFTVLLPSRAHPGGCPHGEKAARKQSSHQAALSSAKPGRDVLGQGTAAGSLLPAVWPSSGRFPTNSILSSCNCTVLLPGVIPSSGSGLHPNPRSESQPRLTRPQEPLHWGAAEAETHQPITCSAAHRRDASTQT